MPAPLLSLRSLGVVPLEVLLCALGSLGGWRCCVRLEALGPGAAAGAWESGAGAAVGRCCCVRLGALCHCRVLLVYCCRSCAPFAALPQQCAAGGAAILQAIGPGFVLLNGVVLALVRAGPRAGLLGSRWSAGMGARAGSSFS